MQTIHPPIVNNIFLFEEYRLDCSITVAREFVRPFREHTVSPAQQRVPIYFRPGLDFPFDDRDILWALVANRVRFHRRDAVVRLQTGRSPNGFEEHQKNSLIIRKIRRFCLH